MCRNCKEPINLFHFGNKEPNREKCPKPMIDEISNHIKALKFEGQNCEKERKKVA